MKLAVDSSAFAKRYIQEHGSEQLDDLLRNASELAMSILLVPEIVSALNRRVREGALDMKNYRMVKTHLLNDVRDASILQTTPSVIARTVALLETNVLRAMDAIHVACAIEWQADVFATSDKRQWLAAKNAGLAAEYLGQP